MSKRREHIVIMEDNLDAKVEHCTEPQDRIDYNCYDLFT